MLTFLWSSSPLIANIWTIRTNKTYSRDGLFRAQYTFLVAGGASGKVASKSRHQCKKASEIIPAETAMVEDAVLVRLQKVGACRWWPSNRWQITTQLRQILGVSNVRTLENIKQMQVVRGKPLTFHTTLYLSFILHSLHQSLKQIGRKYFNGQYKILRVFCVGYRKEVGFT